MSFPDPLNPRTYFYKAALAGCAPVCGSAHMSALRSLAFFQAVAREIAQLLPPFFLISLKLNLWRIASTSWPPLSNLPHPSFLCLGPPPPHPEDFFPRQFLRHAHRRASPRLTPASHRSKHGTAALLTRFHAPVHHKGFREMLHAALTQLDGPIPKELEALYCEEASYRR